MANIPLQLIALRLIGVNSPRNSILIEVHCPSTYNDLQKAKRTFQPPFTTGARCVSKGRRNSLRKDLTNRKVVRLGIL